MQVMTQRVHFVEVQRRTEETVRSDPNLPNEMFAQSIFLFISIPSYERMQVPSIHFGQNFDENAHKPQTAPNSRRFSKKQHRCSPSAICVAVVIGPAQQAATLKPRLVSPLLGSPSCPTPSAH